MVKMLLILLLERLAQTPVYFTIHAFKATLRTMSPAIGNPAQNPIATQRNLWKHLPENYLS